MAKMKTVAILKSEAAKKTPVARAIEMLPIAGVHMVTQVRTEFDAETIKGLSESLMQYGQMQPITVRRASEAEKGGGADSTLNPRPNFDYVVIAGHRRLMAAKMAGWSHIEAVVTDEGADVDRLRRLQLVENLQRDDLTTKDTAAALRALYDANPEQTLDDLGAAINKSKAWISKRLSTTFPDFSAFAKLVMDGGKIADIEIIQLLNQADKAGAGFEKLKDAQAKLESGEWNRKNAKDFLDEVRASKAAAAPAAVVNVTPEGAAVGVPSDEPADDDTAEAETSGPPPVSGRVESTVTVGKAVDIIETRARNGAIKELQDYVDALSTALVVQVCQSVIPDHQAGAVWANATPTDRLHGLAAWGSVKGGELALAAFVLGATKTAGTMPNLIKTLKAMNAADVKMAEKAKEQATK